jgi:uncharacterized membrane protein
MSNETFGTATIEGHVPANVGHVLPSLPRIVEILIASLVAGIWIRLAFFPNLSAASSLIVELCASFVFAGLVLLLVSTITLTSERPSQTATLREQLGRCSLSSLVLLLFFPEYLARVQPALLRSLLLLTIVTTLWLALTLICVYSGRRSRLSDRRAHQIAVAMLVALFGITTAVAVRKYLVFGYVGQDLAYFSQIMHTTLEGHLFWGNILQDLIYSRTVTTDFAGHNSPIMFLFLPFYGLFPSPITLIVLRNAVLIASAIPVFLIARRTSSVPSAWLWGAAFLLTPAILYQTTFDFYPLTFVVFPLLFTLYFYLEKRYIAFGIALLATLLVREDLSLFATGLGVLAFIQKRTLRWAVLPLAAGLFWGALSFLVILPSALKGATFVTDACFTHLGHGPAEMVRDVLLHPRSTIFVHGNLVYLKTLLTPTALLLSLGSPVSLLSLPFVAINLLAGAGRCITTVIYAQYSAIPATILFAGTLIGITHAKSRGYITSIANLGLPSTTTAPLLQIALACASLVFVTGQMQWAELQEQPWGMEARHVLTLIPAAASVAAPRYLLPQLSNRDCLFQTHRLAQYHTPRYEYLILDTDWKHINAAAEYEIQYSRLIEESANNPSLRLLYSSPAYNVYWNPAAAGQGCLPRAERTPNAGYAR